MADSAPPQPRPRALLGRTAAAVGAPLAVVYGCLFASVAVARPLSDLGRPGYVLLQWAVSLALCLAPLAVWPFRTRRYAQIASSVLAVLALVNLVHVFEYSQLVTLGAIDAVASTSGREAGEFLRGRPASVVSALAASAVAGVLAVRLSGRVPPEAGVPRAARAAAAALGAAAVLTLAAYPMRLFPVSTVKNAVDYVGYQADFSRAQQARASHRFGATQTGAWDEPPVVVVVVGESLRRDQLGLYGYGRPTTPRLSALDGLVVFADAVTAAPVTQPSLAMMMTAATPHTHRDHAERSWLTLAREVGFETVWISNQDRTDGTATALLAGDADRVVYTSHDWSAAGQYDEDVLPALDRALAGRTGPLAVVVHLMGSHDDYAQRYPPAFDHFDPDSPRPAAHTALSDRQRRMVDYYDNSVRYTDWVVSEVVRRVEGTGAPAVGVFVSDHGENLYDTADRLRGHGVPGTTRHEVEVPLAVWTTPAFRRARPGVVRALERNRALPVTTADLFYGLADLVGAGWPGHRPDRSVFAPGYQPGPRPVLTPDLEVVAAEDLGARPALAAVAGR